MSSHQTPALLGVIGLQQGDRSASQKAFATALQQIEELLARSSQFYGALDTKGLVLCGLALCGKLEHIPAAKEAYRAARAINSDAGVVAHALKLFDALAKADTDGILAEVRKEAAGARPE